VTYNNKDDANEHIFNFKSEYYYEKRHKNSAYSVDRLVRKNAKNENSRKRQKQKHGKHGIEQNRSPIEHCQRITEVLEQEEGYGNEITDLHEELNLSEQHATTNEQQTTRQHFPDSEKLASHRIDNIVAEYNKLKQQESNKHIDETTNQCTVFQNENALRFQSTDDGDVPELNNETSTDYDDTQTEDCSGTSFSEESNTSTVKSFNTYNSSFAIDVDCTKEYQNDTDVCFEKHSEFFKRNPTIITEQRSTIDKTMNKCKGKNSEKTGDTFFKQHVGKDCMRKPDQTTSQSKPNTKGRKQRSSQRQPVGHLDRNKGPHAKNSKHESFSKIDFERRKNASSNEKKKHSLNHNPPRNGSKVLQRKNSVEGNNVRNLNNKVENGRHQKNNFEKIVDRRRLGNGTCRFEKAVLDEEISQWNKLHISEAELSTKTGNCCKCGLLRDVINVHAPANSEPDLWCRHEHPYINKWNYDKDCEYFRNREASSLYFDGCTLTHERGAGDYSSFTNYSHINSLNETETRCQIPDADASTPSDDSYFAGGPKGEEYDIEIYKNENEPLLKVTYTSLKPSLSELYKALTHPYRNGKNDNRDWN